MVNPIEPAGGRFPLGQTMITRNANAELSADDVRLALDRHSIGDWGDLDAEDKASNDEALLTEGRLLSAYNSSDGKRFYVITEWDRSVTTVLLTSDY